MSVVMLYGDGLAEPVTLDGSPDAGVGILRGLEGWLGTPGSKVDLTERREGDGAHDVAESELLYSARTVTIQYRLLAQSWDGRERMLAMQDALRALLGREVTVRVIDGDRDHMCRGYVDSIDVAETAQNVNWQTMTGQVVVVCPRPQILSWDAHLLQLTCNEQGVAGVGLCYGPRLATYWEGEPNNSVSVLVTDTNAGTSGLHYPLSYFEFTETDNMTAGVLHNTGSAPAFPQFLVHGPLEHGIKLSFPGTGLTLEYGEPVGDVPVLLDARTRRASIDGADCSAGLRSRGFPTVPPHGDLRVELMTMGRGYVDCSAHDTYM
ncbi:MULTISPECIES: hypothetical protein [Bifidobacterium]|nr:MULTISPECIES: hypothetical protein [Bifidobacterium]